MGSVYGFGFQGFGLGFEVAPSQNLGHKGGGTGGCTTPLYFNSQVEIFECNPPFAFLAPGLKHKGEGVQSCTPSPFFVSGEPKPKSQTVALDFSLNS